MTRPLHPLTHRCLAVKPDYEQFPATCALFEGHVMPHRGHVMPLTHFAAETWVDNDPAE